MIIIGICNIYSVEVYAKENSELSGGAAAVTGQLDGVGYAAKLYNAENGLPTSDANTIFSSSDGFIWIGGYSGLIRYDGTSFERQDSSSGIANVNTLYEDSKRRLWVGTNDNGVVCTYKSESIHFSYENGLKSSSIRSIVEDENENIIIGTTQGIYYIDQDMNVATVNDSQIKNSYVQCLKRGKDNVIYGSTMNGAIFRIKDLRVTDYYNSSDLGVGTVTTIFPSPDSEGEVWLGTDNGLICRGSFDDSFGHIKRTFIYYNQIRMIKRHANEHAF